MIVPRKASQAAMNDTDWIRLSKRRAIQKRILNGPYSRAYPVLLSHFKVKESLDWDAAVIGLHIVYGWMPTIPRLGQIMIWDDSKKQQLVDCLSKAKSGDVPSDSSLLILMEFCNNSMVGGSKLLHFLNPDMFPIWDSRVAKVFLQNPKAQGQQVNSIKAWKAYRATLEKWITKPDVKKRCEELRGLAVFLNGVTNLRLVELVMFRKTASKRKRGKDPQ